jgi:hypothetical protein
VVWYDENPEATTKRFIAENNKSISFSGGDLNLGIGHANAETKLFIVTILDPSTGTPVVVTMELVGKVNDLYDWQTEGADSGQTWLGIDIWGLVMCQEFRHAVLVKAQKMA